MSRTARPPLIGTVLAALVMVIGLVTAIPSAATTGSAIVAPAAEESSPEQTPAATDEGPVQNRYRPAGCATLTAEQRASAIPHARCYALGYTTPAGSLMTLDDGPPATALGPADIQDAYHLPDGGDGQTVAVVLAGGYAAAEADLAVFRAHYGLPPCTTENGCFTKIDQRGGTDYPPEDPDWSVEAALDLDAVSSACPKCNLVLVQGDSPALSDLAEAVQSAADLGVTAISNSYGIDGEHPSQLLYDQYYDQPGTAVIVSSGDTGNVQSWPATSPTVLSVGGTTLSRDSSDRGWTESVWGSAAGGGGAGSGCSLYEPARAWQSDIDTGCGERAATADISADADPQTGLAVYNSTAWGGWAQFGGTSLSAPLVAGMYALAGDPTPGTYPASYPYANTTGLNDVTDGANGSCGNLLCQAAPGWDGPTGLGTPNGVSSLTQGKTGEIAGVVTVSSGTPIEGVTITATDPDGRTFSATSDDAGHYLLPAPVGTYSVTATLFGYAGHPVEGVSVAEGEQVTADFALTKLPSQTVSGYVTDASGHGWPLRAKITIDAAPGAVVYSDPYTGRYSLELPTGASYTLHAAAADLPGYAEIDVPVDLTTAAGRTLPVRKPRGGTDAATSAARGVSVIRTDIDIPVDAESCTTPGYAYRYTGTATDFDGWTGEQPQDGWAVTDEAGTGKVWAFDDLGNKGNRTGGSGDFAIVDDWYFPKAHDTSLVTPAMDMGGIEDPEIGFQSDYSAWGNSVATVDLSLDGGDTWETLWEQTTEDQQGHVSIPIPQAAGQQGVLARFRYVGQYDNWWQLDDVYVGSRSCDPTPGGLVAGAVTDNNTGDPLNGVTVASGPNPGDFGVSAPTTDDVNVPDGYYWLFSSQLGATELAASLGQYRPAPATVTVPADHLVRQDFALKAGQLTINADSIDITQRLGQAKSKVVKFKNTGTEPLHVDLSEQDRGMTPLLNGPSGSARTATTGEQAPVEGAPLSRLSTEVSYRPHLASDAGPGEASAPEKTAVSEKTAGSSGLAANGVPLRPAEAGAAGDAWQSIANFPTPIMDNVVATLGTTVYSVGGYTATGDIPAAYSYDPAAQQWSTIANLPAPRQAAQGEFIGGKLYVAGGWDPNGDSADTTYAYDPATDLWSERAAMPEGLAAGASAVVDGRLVIVGGCGANCNSQSAAVYSYDPATDTWTRHADYPQPVAFHSCAGVDGQVICTGGVHVETSREFLETYVYELDLDSWTRAADAPATVAGAAASASGGRLQMVGGVVDGQISNQAFEYDPTGDSWAELPNADHALYRGGGACGMFRIGGAPLQLDATPFAEHLPGYDCDAAEEVSWLTPASTAFDLKPGKSVKVRVTLDSTTVAEPGEYRAVLQVQTDTPYRIDPIGTTMQVNPPARWGKLIGTVTDTDGAPLPGVTVEVCTMYTQASCGPVTFTLVTNSRGEFRQWLDKGFSPVGIIAAKDGYKPQHKVAKVRQGETTAVAFRLVQR